MADRFSDNRLGHNEHFSSEKTRKVFDESSSLLQERWRSLGDEKGDLIVCLNMMPYLMTDLELRIFSHSSTYWTIFFE